MRVLTVVGARPQFIKAAPLSTAIRRDHDEYLVHTGQHYDDEMSATFFRQLNIPEPDANLGVGSHGHGKQTAEMLAGLETILLQTHPDWMLVYGDTNSTLAGALAAAKLNIPIAHVEAGLRSYNRAMPEEVNRVLTDHVARLLFCPTKVAVENLAKEGIKRGVIVTGDIMVDAVHHARPRAEKESTIHEKLSLAPTDNYAAVTIHRPANTDDKKTLSAIMDGLAHLDMPVIFPAHPRTKHALEKFNITVKDSVRVISPLGYLDMLALLGSANCLITDSGGLQKEAYLLETPCITVRTETEWVETVESGWNRLVEPIPEAILAAVHEATTANPIEHPDFYGDGNAALRIVQAMESTI